MWQKVAVFDDVRLDDTTTLVGRSYKTNRLNFSGTVSGLQMNKSPTELPCLYGYKRNKVLKFGQKRATYLGFVFSAFTPKLACCWPVFTGCQTVPRRQGHVLACYYKCIWTNSWALSLHTHTPLTLLIPISLISHAAPTFVSASVWSPGPNSSCPAPLWRWRTGWLDVHLEGWHIKLFAAIPIHFHSEQPGLWTLNNNK